MGAGAGEHACAQRAATAAVGPRSARQSAAHSSHSVTNFGLAWMQTITDCPGPSLVLVRRVRRDDQDVARGGVQARIPGLEGHVALLDDPRLVVRVAVKSWSASGVAAVEDQRDTVAPWSAPVRLPFPSISPVTIGIVSLLCVTPQDAQARYLPPGSTCDPPCQRSFVPGSRLRRAWPASAAAGADSKSGRAWRSVANSAAARKLPVRATSIHELDPSLASPFRRTEQRGGETSFRSATSIAPRTRSVSLSAERRAAARPLGRPPLQGA